MKGRGTTWRRLCDAAFALPGVQAGTSYSTPALHVGRKLLARLREDGETVVVRVGLLDRDVLLAADPRAFFVTDHYLAHPWILVRLRAARHAAVVELVEEAWRREAPKRLVTGRMEKDGGGRVTGREPSPEARLRTFLARYDPTVARVAMRARARLRRLLPGALELVYDNYNALAIGFGPTERASDVICSIALYPRWVSLFFMHGAELPDPDRRLSGAGRRVRHLVLTRAEMLDEASVRRLVASAVASHPTRLPGFSRRRVIIKSVSKKQRPRRPAERLRAT